MIKEQILSITKKLLPTGRAFRFPPGGILEKVNKGLIEREGEAYIDALSVLDSILPDNDGFTAQDATDWERRLGLITSVGASLADRKAAILSKMQSPGTIIARQHYLFLQRQLRAANFDVYVHENRFFEGGEWITKTPFEVSGFSPSDVRHKTELQHGQTQHGGGAYPKIANSTNSIIDDTFSVGNNYRSTFFIGGEVVGSFAEIDDTRIKEFRQLVLRIKPAQTVGFLFTNFVPAVAVYDYGDDYGTDYTLE